MKEEIVNKFLTKQEELNKVNEELWAIQQEFTKEYFPAVENFLVRYNEELNKIDYKYPSCQSISDYYPVGDPDEILIISPQEFLIKDAYGGRLVCPINVIEDPHLFSCFIQKIEKEYKTLFLKSLIEKQKKLINEMDIVSKQLDTMKDKNEC